MTGQWHWEPLIKMSSVINVWRSVWLFLVKFMWLNCFKRLGGHVTFSGLWKVHSTPCHINNDPSLRFQGFNLSSPLSWAPITSCWTGVWMLGLGTAPHNMGNTCNKNMFTYENKSRIPWGASNVFYGFVNANNIRIWVGGWVLENQAFRDIIQG